VTRPSPRAAPTKYFWVSSMWFSKRAHVPLITGACERRASRLAPAPSRLSIRWHACYWSRKIPWRRLRVSDATYPALPDMSIPRSFDRIFEDPRAGVNALMKKVRGHRMAKAAIETGRAGTWKANAPVCRCGGNLGGVRQENLPAVFFDWDSGFAPRNCWRRSQKRRGLGLPAYQDQDQTGMGTSMSVRKSARNVTLRFS